MDDNVKQDEIPSENENNAQRFDQLASKINSASSHDEIINLLRDQLLSTCEVEMASIFLIDSLKMQLVSWLVLPGESVRKIRISIDKTSIAGYTASTRRVVLIQDPYSEDELYKIDPELKFDSSWDQQTGIRTRQVLAAPIMIQRSLLGIIQLMNKKEGKVFSEDDKHHVENLASTIGNALLALQSTA